MYNKQSFSNNHEETRKIDYDTLDKEVYQKTMDFEYQKEIGKSGIFQENEEVDNLEETKYFNGMTEFSNGRNQNLDSSMKYMEMCKLNPLLMKGKENKETFYHCYPHIQDLVEKNVVKGRVTNLSLDNPFLNEKRFLENNFKYLENSGIISNQNNQNKTAFHFDNTIFYKGFENDKRRSQNINHFPYLNSTSE